jgi:hypothetical protein
VWYAHSFDAAGPSATFHVSLNLSVGAIPPTVSDRTRAFTRNDPTCARSPSPASAVGAFTAVPEIALLPVAFGSYAPTGAPPVPENPDVTMLSLSISSDVAALYVNGPSSPHSTCRRDCDAVSVMISRPSAGTSPSEFTIASVTNGALAAAVDVSVSTPRQYGLHVSSTVTVGLFANQPAS